MFLFVYYNCCNIPESFRNLLSFGVRRYCVNEENQFAEYFKDLLGPPIHLADDLLRRRFKTTKYVFSMAGIFPILLDAISKNIYKITHDFKTVYFVQMLKET